MQGHFWHLFLIQFFMLFHKVVSVLLSMVAFSTTFLLVQTIQQPIRIFEISGYWSYHGEQNAGYHVKEHEKLYQKQVSKVTLHFVWGHLSKKQTVGWVNSWIIVVLTWPKPGPILPRIPAVPNASLFNMIFSRLIHSLFITISRISEEDLEVGWSHLTHCGKKWDAFYFLFVMDF